MPNAGAFTDEVVDGFLPWSASVPDSCRLEPDKAERARERASEAILDVDRDVLDDERSTTRRRSPDKAPRGSPRRLRVNLLDDSHKTIGAFPYSSSGIEERRPLTRGEVHAAISEECNYCCECLEVCSVGAVNLAEGNIDNDLCTECGACQEACPIDAIFEPLYQEIKRDSTPKLAPTPFIRASFDA